MRAIDEGLIKFECDWIPGAGPIDRRLPKSAGGGRAASRRDGLASLRRASVSGT